MAVESRVKRIGGSTFAILPPDLVKELDLHPEDRVLLEVKPLGGTAEEVLRLKGKHKSLPAFDRGSLWGE